MAQVTPAGISARCSGKGLSISTKAPRRVAARAVATPPKQVVQPNIKEGKRTAVESIKEESQYLRYPLIDELKTEATNINEAAAQLMKFHGSYMQDDRDKRTFGTGKWYQFMMRTRTPSGVVHPKLWATMDDLSDQYGNGTLRLTTRQAFQLHGILKKDLKTVFSSVIRNMGSTLAACGDVNRNVMSPPVPLNTPEYKYAEEYATLVADMLSPQGGGYYDVWLDGEQVMTQEAPICKEVREDNSTGINKPGGEPIYGDVYLPRKFKIAVTVPGDNSIDAYIHDICLVTITNAKGELEGFNVIAGGGMGRSHRNDETYPRIGSLLGFVPADKVLYAVKSIVCVQRDYGRRDDRKQARLKYTIDKMGLDVFTSRVEEYMGAPFAVAADMPEWEFRNYLGWGESGDGKLYYGVHVVNGRVRGDLKKALRQIIERYEIESRLTANQDVVLCGIDPSWKADIDSTLKAAGAVGVEELDALSVNSIACPALPLCGLAITEAERGLPDVNARLSALLTKMGMDGESFIVRMTGCPNGCARPYMAELGFVGDGPNSYQIWLGGSPRLDRLCEAYDEKVKLQNFEAYFEPLFAFFKARRTEGESFGDFCHRVGFVALREFQKIYVSPAAASSTPRLPIEAATLEKVKTIAAASDLTLAETVAKIVDAYKP